MVSGTTYRERFSIGDGRHGAFQPSTYSQFSTGGDVSGNIIRLDLSQYPELQVTRFELAAGWTLQPSGNRGLVIRSLSDIQIDGTIQCNGANGSPGVNNPNTMAAGGAGRCGGGNGGNGGTTGQAATNGSVGEITFAGITGGFGATGTSGGGGGGGGGFPKDLATIPTAGAGTTPGTFGGYSITDPHMRNLGGGAGGGGGAPSGTWSGGGGGGGGGRVDLFAYGNVIINSNLSVNGGSGGSTAGNSGGGGAGGSGRVWILAGGTFSGSGSINAVQVSGGTTAGGGAGGNGSLGRIWGADSTGAGSAPLNPNPSIGGLSNEGTAAFETGTFSLTSSALDFNNHHAELIPATFARTVVNSSSGSLRILVRGSRKGFQSESSDVIDLNSGVGLGLFRYLVFQVDLTNNSATNPLALTQFQFDFTKGSPARFEYRPIYCGSTQKPGGAWLGWLFIFAVWGLLKMRGRLFR